MNAVLSSEFLLFRVILSGVLTTLLLGFALGLRHATDADHIVAVTGLLDRAATRTPRAAATLGALWGLGHMTAVLLAGGIVIALRVAIPGWLEWLLELAVALVLIGLGVHILLNCFRGRYHFHRHAHGPLPHSHLHFHQQGTSPEDHAAHLGGRLGAAWLRHRAPVLLGAVHGLAGSAGLALLVLATIPSRMVGALYLLAFGGGALLGMAAFSAILSWPLGRAGRSDRWLTRVRFAAGAANAALGAFLIYRAVQPGSWPF